MFHFYDTFMTLQAGTPENCKMTHVVYAVGINLFDFG